MRRIVSSGTLFLSLSLLLAAGGCSSQEPSAPAPGSPDVPVASLECPPGLLSLVADSPAMTPAARAPRIEAPSAALLCTYPGRGVDAAPTGTSDGDPRALTDSELTDLGDALPGLVPANPERACTRDTGPVMLLLMQVRGGVLGLEVEQYGCWDSRLVIDPHNNAAGTSADDLGAVAGILTPSAELRSVVEGVSAR